MYNDIVMSYLSADLSTSIKGAFHWTNFDGLCTGKS
jgi:hypothetical protein